MQHLDLIALRYFAETAQSGSIRLAADRLHVTPSAVSRRIAKLEQQLNTILFERRATGVSMTSAGEILLAEVRAIHKQLRRAQELISDLDGQRRGLVTLLCMEGAADNWISHVISDYREQHPLIEFNVGVASTDQSVEALSNGACDIAVVFKGHRKPEVEVVARGKEPLVALMAPQHSLSECSSLTLAEVLTHGLVLPDRSFGLRQAIEKEAGRLGIPLQPLITTNTIALTRSIVRDGSLMTILPRLSAAHDCKLGLLKAVPISKPSNLNAEIELCVRKGTHRSAASNGMLSALQTSFSQFVLEVS